MSPLVLLVLLAFFFVVALAFTVWAALNVGSAARRAQAAAEYAPNPARRRARREPEPRERKPWEKAPEPAAPKERQQRKSRKEDGRPAPKDVSTGSGGRGPVVQGTLWEKRPEPTPAPSGKAVVTPRKPASDAFERFLEAEKRRD